jgi:hypothetical protein
MTTDGLAGLYKDGSVSLLTKMIARKMTGGL